MIILNLNSSMGNKSWKDKPTQRQLLKEYITEKTIWEDSLHFHLELYDRRIYFATETFTITTLYLNVIFQFFFINSFLLSKLSLFNSSNNSMQI